MLSREHELLEIPPLERPETVDETFAFDNIIADEELTLPHLQATKPNPIERKRKAEAEDLVEERKQARIEHPALFIAKEMPHISQRNREREKRLQQKLDQQKCTINELKLQVQQLKAQRAIPETLSEKILKHMESRSSARKSYNKINDNSPIINIYDTTQDYSQKVLLKKINCYLELHVDPPISEEGHCHGLTLLWLTMMSWGLESLFYALIKKIAECPDWELLSLTSEITILLEWIELGQSPGKYSNNMYNQHHVAEIIGVTSIMKIHQEMDENELCESLRRVSEDDNSMAAIVGWHTVEEDDPVTEIKIQKEKGHTIGLFFKNNAYHLYDCNYENGEPKTFDLVNKVTAEVRHRLFNNLNITPGEKSKYTINLVTQQLPKPPLP